MGSDGAAGCCQGAIIFAEPLASSLLVLTVAVFDKVTFICFDLRDEVVQTLLCLLATYFTDLFAILFWDSHFHFS